MWGSYDCPLVGFEPTLSNDWARPTPISETYSYVKSSLASYPRITDNRMSLLTASTESSRAMSRMWGSYDCPLVGFEPTLSNDWARPTPISETYSYRKWSLASYPRRSDTSNGKLHSTLVARELIRDSTVYMNQIRLKSKKVFYTFYLSSAESRKTRNKPLKYSKRAWNRESIHKRFLNVGEIDRS
jgi:hypothetical protein